MDPGRIFQIITNSTLLATRLLSESGTVPVEFTQSRYCAVLREDARVTDAILNVKAVHKLGAAVKYTITGGNKDGLFTIDQNTGEITLAAALDYESRDKHELGISGETEGHTVHTVIQVRVADVNDNPPYFLDPDPEVTVIEEEDSQLPSTLLKVEANDRDSLDHQGLLYTVRGDGVDGYKPGEAYFTINSITGELIQQRALDRDPPEGKAVWKVRVQVRDGQALWSRPRDKREVVAPDYTPNLATLRLLSVAERRRISSGSWTLPTKRGDQKEEITGDDVNGERDLQRRRSKREQRESARRMKARPRKNREGRIRKENQCSKSLPFGRDNLRQRRNGIALNETKLENVQKVFRQRGKRSNGQRMFQKGHYSDTERNEGIIHSNKFSLSHRGFRLNTYTPRGDPKTKKRQHQSSFPDIRHFLSSTGGDKAQEARGEGNCERDKRHGRGSLIGRILEGEESGWQDLPQPSDLKNSVSGHNSYIRGSRRIKKPEVREEMKKPEAKRSFRENRNDIAVPLLKRKERTVTEEVFDGHHLMDSEPSEDDCDWDDSFNHKRKNITADPSNPWANTDISAYGIGGRTGRVHLVETTVTIIVKDVNDNPPVFPNASMFAEVQENGPIDLPVVTVSATDEDDPEEGANAKLRYSIERNALQEASGDDVFKVDPNSGLISTAVCCLDRETTPEYQIQVAATDGGGLKGTAMVFVRLVDVNDNSPRLAQRMWEADIDETWGDGPPDNSTLLEISVNDRDLNNYFFYRVVEESGNGWDLFDIRTVGNLGHLYARQTLDFEDEDHRKGFRFLIQVTDKGRGGWFDGRHLDSAWVKVRLKDLNDNPPSFPRSQVRVTVREDASPGTVLASLPAYDFDKEGKEGVEYHVVGGWNALAVDDGGVVSLWRPLDREAPEGDLGIANVIAVDQGQPPLSSTATLTISVTDVNDCPPRLLHPTVFHVAEGVPPMRLGVLAATDQDMWELGHGPPFMIALAPSNSAAVKDFVDIRFSAKLNSGRGGADVWTKAILDREMDRELKVEILLKDAQGLSGTQAITIVVDDVNDNPMRPASKTVYLWKTQTGNSEAPLGRVYVDDPDDWDIEDKSFHWLGQPHPLFSLDSKEGTVVASSQVREGRYELQFAVDDILWGQHDISANVSVVVRLLTEESIAHSAPLILMPTTPQRLTAGWTPMKGGGGLGKLIDAIKEILEYSVHSIEVVSIYDVTNSTSSSHWPEHFTSLMTSSENSSIWYTSSREVEHNVSVAQPLPPPATCVWISVKEKSGHYMNPVRMQGILGLHSQDLESAMNLTVVVESRRRPVLSRETNKAGWNSVKDSFPETNTSPPLLVDLPDPSSAASRTPLSLPFQVVDTNSTSLVTPHLTQSTHCSSQESETCTPISCLNGGRCIKTLHGNRCVCPSGSWGSKCKILSRTFNGSGFAWIQPIPACIPTVISLRILTQRQEGLLFYAGPLTQYARHSTSTVTPLLALQVVQGEVQMLVEGGRSPLKLQVNTQVTDGNWHIIHVQLDKQGASLMVDLCSSNRGNQSKDDSHCISRMQWRDPEDAELWLSASPIQIGGLAHSRPSAHSHGWKESPTSHPLDGCLSQLVINGQFMDLGEPALSRGSVIGCLPQESSCGYSSGTCGVRGTCVAGLDKPECHCDPGWTGPNCGHSTMAARFGPKSFIKMTLSFTPAPRVISVQVRVRTWGRRSGLILRLGMQPTKSSFSLQLQKGIACASLSHKEKTIRSVCVEGYSVGDGQWHTIRTECYGHNLIVNVDDGDGIRQNYSLPSLFESSTDYSRRFHQYLDNIGVPPTIPMIDFNEGMSVGGLPEFENETIINVTEDLEDTCLDDLRISGQTIPLVPSLNKTTWMEVTSSEGVESGCSASDACLSITCSSPLSCINNWGRPMCSCGPGHQLIGNVCEDINECLWQPCLHGGSCYNMDPGFLCTCGPNYSGEHCQWKKYNNSLHPLAGPAALAVITISLLFMVFVGVFLTLRLRRHWVERKLARKGERTPDGAEDLSTEEATIIEVKGGTEEGGGADAIAVKMEATQEILLESLHLVSPSSQTAHRSKESHPSSKPTTRRPSKASLCRAAAMLGDQTAALGDTYPAKDDLRAYAYEGEGSSAGSLSSALSELKVEKPEDSPAILAPAFLDVMDLLKTLPDATNGFKSEPPDPPEDLCSLEGSGLTSIGESPIKKSMPTSVSKGKPKPATPRKGLREGKDDGETISTLC